MLFWFRTVILILATIFFSEIRCDDVPTPPVVIPVPGAWYPHGQCPSGTFIKALRLKYARRKAAATAGSGRTRIEVDPVGYGDETGLKYLEIFCSNSGIIDTNSNVKSIYSMDDEYSYLTCPGNTYATDFQLFFTTWKVGGVPATNSWYLGPHPFAESCCSSLRLFCGKSYDWSTLFSGGPKEDYDGPKYSDSSTSCRWEHNKEAPVLCGLFPDQQSWYFNYTKTFEKKCCFHSSSSVICEGGRAEYGSIKECDNIKGQSPIVCEVERRVGVSYDDTQRDIDILTQKKLGMTLTNVAPNLMFRFQYNNEFTISAMPETISEEKNYGTIVETVKPGNKLTFLQYLGRCGVYVMKTDVFRFTTSNLYGQETGRKEDIYPLRPRKKIN